MPRQLGAWGPLGPAQGTPAGALLVYVPEGGDQDGILLHPAAPRWARANRSTRQIVARLADGPEAAVAFLVQEYGLSPESAREDVAQVMVDLERQGLAEGGFEDSGPRIGSLYLMLTERCNLACAHCCGSFPARQELPLASVLRLVEELIAGGGRSLVLSGGEPLLHPGLEEIVARVGKRIPVQFCTNGTLLDARWAGLFAEKLDPLFQISLDGPSAAIHDAIRGAGAFAGALRGIRHLQEAGLGDRIILATTIQKKNQDVLLEVAQLAAELAVKKLRFLPLRKEGRARETWDCTGEGLDVSTYEGIFDRFLGKGAALPEGVDLSCGLNGFSLLSSTSEHWCSVGRQMVVAASGDAFPCAVLMREDCRLGNIHGASLLDLVQGEAMARLHATKLRRKEEIGRCRPCLWRNFCQSGCMALALEETGSLWDVDGLCAYRCTAYERAFDAILASGQREKN